jgi:DNA-binding NtrC family response regulator
MTPPASTLLVEDNDGLAMSLVSAFNDHNLNIERAQSWEEGLRSFRAAGHELVIADYNLPGSEHGLLLLLQVKQLLPSTRLVLISGALSQQAERALKPPGLIDAYFRKHVGLADDLLPWITDAFERAHQPTDWRRFASGHLSDPDEQRAEVQRIDSILRADIEHRD